MSYHIILYVSGVNMRICIVVERILYIESERERERERKSKSKDKQNKDKEEEK